MSKIGDALNDIFFPSGIKCIVCDDDIPQGGRYPVCAGCLKEKNLSFCLGCGRNLTVFGYCSKCKKKTNYFDRARAPFIYRGDVKTVIHKLKYGNGKYIADEIAVYLAETYFENSMFADVITYSPMHLKKQKRRGYNQAEELARSFAKRVQKDVIPLLTKTIDTKSNAGQNSKQRAESVKDSIAFNDGSFDIRGKSILFVDDVFTTGATANECAKILKAAGATKVEVLTFATAVEDENIAKTHTLADMPSL